MLPSVSPPSDPALTFLPNYWKGLLLPCFSLLADECQLSIIAVEQATPLLLNGIYYQFIHLTQSPQAKPTFINSHFSNSTNLVQGINFHQISQLRPQITSFHQSFFSNERAFWVMVGVVSARTGISPSGLQPLTDWLAFLALQSTAQCLTLTHTNVMTFIDWLPHSLPDPNLLDITMLESILVDSKTRPSLFFKTSQGLSNTTTDNKLVKDFFVEHKASLQSYQQSQPFGIVPRTIASNNANATPALSKLSQPISTNPHPLSSEDIFTTKISAKTPLYSILQKYWMAFATGLTVVIIGGIGAVATNNKTSQPSTNLDNKALAEIPHDVAIVRTDTNATKTSITSKSTPTTPSSHEKHSTNKDTQKTPASKTKSDKSEKAKESKSPTSHKKAVAGQTEKASIDKKTKSTVKKSIKKPAQSHEDDED